MDECLLLGVCRVPGVYLLIPGLLAATLILYPGFQIFDDAVTYNFPSLISITYLPLQLRQEPQGTSDFRVRSQGPCRLGTGESGLVLG